MRAQHDGRLLSSRKSHHLDMPRESCHGVRDVAHDFTRETLLAVRIDDGEGDRVGGVRNDCEVALQPC